MVSMFGSVLGSLFSKIPTKTGFPKTLTKDDFGITDDIPVKEKQWNKIGEFRVPPQSAYRWGYGHPSMPENQGYMYVLIQDSTPKEIPGKIRLVVSDYDELNKRVIYEERVEVLHGDVSDKKKMKPLPEQGPLAKEDDKLIIEFKPDADATISAANTVIRLPVTAY